MDGERGLSSRVGCGYHRVEDSQAEAPADSKICIFFFQLNFFFFWPCHAACGILVP